MITSHLTVTTFILLLFLCQRGVRSASCPSPCKCARDNKQATCNFFNSTVHMVMNTTSLFHSAPLFLYISCEGSNYKCADLPKLDIKPGKVTLDITSCASSMLKCVNDMYSSVTFEDIAIYDLKDLTIDDFKGFKQLKDIHIRLKDTDTADNLSSIPDVQSLHINGGHLKSLPNMFKGTRPGLVLLSLLDNNMNTLHNDTFSDLTGLHYLTIGNNNIEVIPAAAFRGLVALEELTITTNKNLRSIDPKAFSETKHLDSLRLENSALESLPNGLLTSLDKIRMIQIKNNIVEINLESRVFSNAYLRYLHVTNSKIRVLPEQVFAESSELSQLHFSNNIIEVLPPKLFWTTTSLRAIHFNNNRIKILPEGLFFKLKILNNIDFSNNHIYELTSELFASNPELKNIKLHSNNIIVLDLQVFTGLQLLLLSVSCNRIQKVLASSNLSLDIYDFNLSDNKIYELDDWLVHLCKLQNLNLTRNNIEKIKESDIYISHGYSPFTIDIRYNKLSYIKSDKRYSKHTDLLTSKVQLYLSHNQIHCDDPVIELIKKWQKYEFLMDFEEIVCVTDKHVSPAKQSDIYDKSEDYNKKNNSSNSVVSAASVVFLLLILIIIL